MSEKTNIWNRFYYLIIFLSLISLVFYLGFLYGNREDYASTTDNIKIINANGQVDNTISQIQQRPVLGSVDSEKIEVFGQMYYIINSQNQTEIVINLERIPAKIKQVKGGKEVGIPQKLRVDVAKRVRDQGLETYSYENISSISSNLSILSLNNTQNGLRSGKFSGVINEPVINTQTLQKNIERIVLRSEDLALENVFIDQDSELPIKIRGNNQAGITGQPAPFFWIKI